jgi:ABC-type uncharacterized transport system substrate-binding protein
LIFTLGAKASFIAKTWTVDRPDIPVLFAMVLNWRKYDLVDGQNNVSGITSDVAPGTQLANMMLFAPGIKRIGVIYSSEHSAEILTQARKAAAKLGLELEEREVARSKEFQRILKDMSGRIDAFWVLSDPIIYTLDNIAWLEKRCTHDRLVCVGQSENIAKLGMFLSVNPDIPTIGSQAATMAKRILAGKQSPRSIGVASPLGTRIILNMETVDKIGLSISQSAKDMANVIIEKE